MEKIRIRNLTFQYPLGTGYALNGIDLTIHESDFVVVCGKSGCGKSTLLRQMKKSLIPYGEKSGSVLYEGVSIEDLDQRRDASEIGFVLQDPESQIVTDKVWHELAFGLENLGLPNAVIKRRVAEMASYFGISSWFRQDVASLSGGQKQMLNLASVMAMQPKVLILDEPASQLDPIAATELLNTIYRINRDLGTTVILSEHRLEEAFPMATRVVVLDEGKILAEGTPSDVGKLLAGYSSGKEADGRKEPEKESTGQLREPHPMYFGLPAVMRVFPEQMVREHELPLTIRDGRLLLEQMLQGREMASAGDAAGAGSEAQGGAREAAARGGLLRKRVPEDAALSLRDVYFRYEKHGTDILRGLYLTVRKGEFFCLLGGNGSGKTTTLKVAAGLLKPQRGKMIKAGGLRSALVPQNPQALFTEITVEEEVLEGMAYPGADIQLTDQEKVARVDEMLSLMEISHLRRMNPYDLSGGEQQRLAIAKVMAYRPDILLLDEPTKGLDPFFKRTLGEILRRLTERGTTLLMVSHDIDFCAQYGDVCAMFFDGEITSAGTARTFFRENSYYTTTVNRLVRRWRPDLITCEEARAWLEEDICEDMRRHSDGRKK